jgi:hypothetical protein
VGGLDLETLGLEEQEHDEKEVMRLLVDAPRGVKKRKKPTFLRPRALSNFLPLERTYGFPPLRGPPK